MDPRRRADPEPVEIVLVALDAASGGADADRRADPDRRPPPAGAGTLPALGEVVGTVLARLATVPDPPLVPERRVRPVFSDQRLHRLVRLPSWDAVPALREVLVATGGRILAEPRQRPGRWRRWDGAVLLALPGAIPAGGPVRVSGALHVHGRRRATAIELTLEPWSVHQSDLCLQPHRGRFGVHLPRRYYDAAHRVMDEVWHLIEARAARA